MIETYNGNDLVAVFLANRSGRNKGINKAIYIMSLKDGIKFCTHPKTKSHDWAFHWTILANFVDDKTNKVSLKHFNKKDDGRFADLMNELNITSIELDEIKNEVFKDLDESLSDERLGVALQEIEKESVLIL